MTIKKTSSALQPGPSGASGALKDPSMATTEAPKLEPIASPVENVVAKVKTLKFVPSLDPNKKFVEQLMRDRQDIEPDYIYRCIINQQQYFDKYPDVQHSGMLAADHYFTYGFNESRELKRPGLLKHPQAFRIDHQATLFLSSAPRRDGSFVYRCLFQSKKLKKNLVYHGKTEILKLVRAIFNCKELIFSRPEHNETSLYLIELAKNIGVNVILDYDDLLVPEHAEYLGHVRSSEGRSVDAARNNIMGKSAFLLYADGFRCSTHLIAKAMHHLSKPIEVHKNQILASMVRAKQDCVVRLNDLPRRKLKILYLSGTATHKKDYSIAQGPLIRLAQLYPDSFEITFLGNTGSHSAPIEIFNPHVKTVSRVNFDEMLNIISQHDIALAPLENTIFNNAKSNIKFIECGSQGVPVIASPRDEFKAAITHGVNGWLCESQNEWFTQLEKLIKDPKILHRVSLKARESVIKQHVLGEQ
ncbi:glycosyltransferase [Pseudomonas juntendi]|uniref:Glycosyltransferase n=1 Tax=Pseudomonas juntendi TaxID=2666183 RepID=A0A7W2JJX4_9PSED|nr:glycosyltransferase [Pseudomonas juntendi]MBA6060317.1 glycosyltransferase [Pseudomonas juntendi]MBA6128079.1 glycosyltransferase [Pseudomonas juntendi]